MRVLKCGCCATVGLATPIARLLEEEAEKRGYVTVGHFIADSLGMDFDEVIRKDDERRRQQGEL